MSGFSGKTVLVLGAGGGIGTAISEAFAAAGAHVAAGDLDESALTALAERLAPLSGSCSTSVVDTTRESDIDHLTAECSRSFGSIDILVNCAGSISEVPVASLSLAEWQRTMDTNLTSIVLACRSVLPYMTSKREGRIINIASQIGQRGGARFAHYAAAKGAVIAFTKSLAREVVADGILVNAVAPGPVDTAFVKSLDQDSMAERHAAMPLGRAATAAEVAPSVLLLASSPGGDVYVGQTLGPNCGDVML